MDTGVIEGGLNVTLTIRLLMHGKEVGSIIGKVRLLFPQSGARINISEGNCPERIITLAGPTNAIFKAFAMIIDKLEEVSVQPPALPWMSVPLDPRAGSSFPRDEQWEGLPLHEPLWGLLLALLLAQCPQACGAAAVLLCVTLLSACPQSPPKGVTIPYRPKPSSSPVIFAGGQAYTIQGQYAIPQPDVSAALSSLLLPLSSSRTSLQQGVGAAPPPLQPTLAWSLPPPWGRGGGLGGSVCVDVIRQMSGAQIKIANPVEGSTDRQVTITGSAASISLAQYLI
ncbi:PCBP2 protein, partial [Amazona guildingii]|nr:PCBP2 protein [Amazona guildingii]